MSYLVRGVELGDNAPPPLDTEKSSEERAKDAFASFFEAGTKGVLTGGAKAGQQILTSLIPGMQPSSPEPPPPPASGLSTYVVPGLIILGVAGFAASKALKQRKKAA